MYVIDTSSLVETWLRGFPPDVAPGVWERLDLLIAAGRLIAPDEVLNELERKADDLHAWAADRAGMFVELEDDLIEATRKIVNTPEFQGMMKARPNRNSADPFVIALAQLRGYTVVSEERDDGPTKCKIPHVCRRLDVPCIDFLGLIRAEGWRFRVE